MANMLCHFELMSGNPQKCRAFYGQVFDWQFDEQTLPGYTLVNAGAEPTGAIFAKPDTAPGPCMNVYFQVADIDTTVDRVRDHGGEVLIQKTEIPGTGFFAMFADPEGLVVGVMQPV